MTQRTFDRAEKAETALAQTVQALRELEAEWRADAHELDESTGGQWIEPGVKLACADDLAAGRAALGPPQAP
jgi:hypothetical protein